MTDPRSRRTPQISTPPCTTAEQARDFYRLLMLFIRELKVPGKPVGHHHFLLTQALHQHRPRRDEIACRSCPGPYPCSTLLAVALVSRFPIAWTPIVLARALEPVTGERRFVDENSIAFDYGDGVLTHRLDAGGIWTATDHGRGGTHVREVGDDDAMCALLIESADQFATGLADVDTENELDVIRPGLEPARAWWDRQSQLAYLDSLRFKGATASSTDLGSDDVPAPFLRLTVDDALRHVQIATRAIPTDHRLYGLPLRPVALCDRCWATCLYVVSRRYVMITVAHGDPTGPGTRIEEVADLRSAQAAMRHHGTQCTRRR